MSHDIVERGMNSIGQLSKPKHDNWLFVEKTNKNIVRISALKVFIASLGLPGSFLGLPGDLVSNIINKEKEASNYKNFQGRNPYNIFVAVLENQCPHEFILSLTYL